MSSMGYAKLPGNLESLQYPWEADVDGYIIKGVGCNSKQTPATGNDAQGFYFYRTSEHDNALRVVPPLR